MLDKKGADEPGTSDNKHQSMSNSPLFWNKKINREVPLVPSVKSSRVLTAQALKRLFRRSASRSQSIIVPSLRDKYNLSSKTITRVANSALRMGDAKIPEDQKRIDTVNIDTDDDEISMYGKYENGIIDEEGKMEVDNDADFKEITEQLSDVPNTPSALSFVYVKRSNGQFLAR